MNEKYAPLQKFSLVKSIHDIGEVDHFGVKKMPIASRQM
jgi:hypothetical protein